MNRINGDSRRLGLANLKAGRLKNAPHVQNDIHIPRTYMIPDEVINEIIARAKNDWPSDKQMQKYCISEEKEGYSKLQNIDFGDNEHLRDEFIASAREIFDAWNEVCDWVETELSAYRSLQTFSAEGLPQELIDEWKTQAKEECEDSYEGQFEFIKEKVQKNSSILATRQQIDPIKNLLIELEEIVGNECYNGNIQNYGSWGELESEGRKFRYPVKFYNSTGESKKWTVSSDIPSEELITGYYAFGANELNIYRALFKIVSHLRNNYGLKI